MSTLLLQGAPIGNISGRIFQELRKDPRVALAVPIAMGDNVGGARIIGTDEHFFELRPSLQDAPAFRLAEGRYFATDFEAVLGSRAAAELRLAIGDWFRPQHGVMCGLESDTHAEVHTVVGILQPSNTPFDKAVLTRVESVIDMHAEEGTGQTTQEDNASEALLAGDTASVSESRDSQKRRTRRRRKRRMTPNRRGEPGHSHWRSRSVSSRPTSSGAYSTSVQRCRLSSRARTGQPLRPAGQGQQILIRCWIPCCGDGGAHALVITAPQNREHVLAILRGVGAGCSRPATVVLVETVLMALLGTLFGCSSARVTAAAASIAVELTRQSAIPIQIHSLGAWSLSSGFCRWVLGCWLDCSQPGRRIASMSSQNSFSHGAKNPRTSAHHTITAGCRLPARFFATFADGDTHHRRVKSALSEPAQEFALPALDGGEVRLSSLRGQWVLVNFGATWCAPCRGTPNS